MVYIEVLKRGYTKVDENESLELTDEELESVTGGKYKTIKVKVSEANLRSGPGTNFGVVLRLKKREKISFLGTKAKDAHGKTWLYVNVGNYDGWIRKDLVGR